MARPKAVLAAEAEVEPVPPLAIATVPVTFPALPAILPVTLEPAKEVIHEGLAYEPVVTTPLVTVPALPVIEPLIVDVKVLVPPIV